MELSKRLRCEALREKIMTAEEAALLIRDGENVAVSGFTPSGCPKAVPLALAEQVRSGQRKLRLGLFSAPCVTAELDGKRIANLSLSPSEADLGELSEGEHTLDITVWPSRINSFGTFHLNDHSVLWFGPQAWRSTGARWTYTYRLAPSGLLSEPRLFSYE